jgi:hypothetical protein
MPGLGALQTTAHAVFETLNVLEGLKPLGEISQHEKRFYKFVEKQENPCEPLEQELCLPSQNYRE